MRRVLALGLGLLGLAPASALGQRPGAVPGRFEVPGLDWAPNSAWRARAQRVRDLRRALLRNGQIAQLNAGRPLFSVAAPGTLQAGLATAVTGTFYVPVIPIQFQDVDAPFTAQEFQDVLFEETPPQSRPYTLKTYYEQVSNGMISMFGRVFDPVRTDTTAEYYQQDCNGIGIETPCPDNGARFGTMLIAMLDSISNRPGSDTVWSEFDNDGPDGAPNSGDDDGDVDFVTFLQPVKDGACHPSPGIWAHRWVVSVWNHGSKYVTRTPRTGHPGQFILVNNYTIQSEVGGSGGCTDGSIMPVGTVAHETGHAFGLPDLYDVTNDTQGIGEWGIMGSGNYTTGFSPAGMDPWSLNELGWVTVVELTDSDQITTGPRQTGDTVYLARTDNPDEYLLIENRQAVESDTALLNPGVPPPAPGATCRSKCQKAPGLLLWHIDLLKIDAALPTNSVNTGPVQGVAVVQADGLNQLRLTGNANNRGDEGDPFPGATGNTAYGFRSTPAARTNTGQYTGFIIDQVTPQGQEMSFRFLRRGLSVVRANTPGALIEVDGQAWTVYQDVFPEGTQFTIDADPVQEIVPGRSRALFLSWNNGGPATQTITSGAVPDTLIASFTAEHRLLVTSTGGGQGTVGANVTGDFEAGAFVPAGTPITLTATPVAGAVFAGWRGDTASVANAITLPMNRAYDLEASFLPAVAVDLADATADILGTPTLTAQQRTFLDNLGNRNGLFDLGDYLALLKRNGQAVPPAVLKAAAAARAPEGR